ncbi:T9SS type A sorting domain-containing protein [Chryseobacterium nepalense]|jgi:hypothetical protein|uniref:T9SS type A sorting domain-containing protein n=1 Tax=Chryseobacterium nepalense TaxID=1854498 RepID=A0ABY4K755_9FLAO|nr:T9SS type A sorting domain-containing protein [Chryseobacterium nepalense]MEC5174397.1 hypothetical protein [Chryseobacterium nepalense]UPQ76625.1 T9SS type A sorting domain-containing protein [Chryseobacterium nepalense]
MKKVLLVLLGGMTHLVNAQLTCATATTVTAGTYTAPTITGTYVGTCAPNGDPATPKALWYKYTATANGEVTVSSDLAANPASTDTRVSILSGTCAALACYGGNDDVSATNYKSSVTFPVASGTTYYIQWDNRWSTAGFSWSLTFNASSCIRPNEFSVTSPTAITLNSATLGWGAAIGNPSSYDVQHGLSGFTLGAGTTVNSTTNSAQLNSLPSSQNLSYYIRSNCGATQSAWVGPFSLFLAKTTPYSNSFDAPNLSDGFSGSGWSRSEDDPTDPTAEVLAHTADGFFYTTTSTTASNSQLYSRALSLQAGNANNFNFYTRLYALTTAGGTVPMTLKLYYNTTRSLTGATQIGTAITVNGLTYVQRSASFTVPTTGIYYLIFSNETAATAATTATALLLDTFSLTSVLGTKETTHNNIFLSISPNPTSDILNIKTDSKINAVSVVDMTGRKIEVKMNGSQVDVRSLSTGTYLITVETKEGTSTQKFIKK